MAAAQTESELPRHPEVDVPFSEPSSEEILPDANTKADADTDTTVPHPLHVHKHRLCHNPSKLPGLRFVDRGLLQAQGKPPAGLPPSLPQSAVSPPCPAGVDSHQDPTEPTNTGPDTARSENSAHGWPQSRLRPVTAALEPSPKKVVKPVVIHSIETPLQQQQQQTLTVSSLLLPVHEADETQSPSADDTCTEPGSASNPRERRASVIKHSPQSTSNLSFSEHSPPTQRSTYTTAWTAASVITPVAASTGRSAALRIINANATPATANSSSPLAPRSEVGTDSSRFHTPSSRPRPRRTSSWNYNTPTRNPPARRSFSLDSNGSPSPLLSRASKSANTNERAPAQQEVLLSKAVNLSPSNENNKTSARRTSSASRPPTSYKPLPSGYASSARIPPIRSFRLPGFRKSYPPDMNHPSSRYYDDGDDGDDQGQRSRERSLRALEGRYTNDRARDLPHPDLDDDVAESENNTADIFMNIAREDSSTSIPRRQTNRGSDDEKSTVVSPVCPCVCVRWRTVCASGTCLPTNFGSTVVCPFAG